MAYDVYFDNILFPIAPAKISTKINNKNKTITLINEGEVNLLKDAGLTKVSFEILLPNHKYPFAKYTNGFKSASFFLDALEDFKIKKKPFQFIVSRTLPTGSVLFYTDLKVSLESYTIEDDASNGFDVKVTVELTQYKPYGTKTTDISAYIRSKNRADGNGANNGGTKYTIVSGDTLWGIAKKKLGDGSKWTLIYNANKDVIENAAKSHGKASSSNGHWIWPGTQIVIPNGSSSSSSSKSISSSSSSSSSSSKSKERNSLPKSSNLQRATVNLKPETKKPYIVTTSNGGKVLSKFSTYEEAKKYYESINGDDMGLEIYVENDNGKTLKLYDGGSRR